MKKIAILIIITVLALVSCDSFYGNSLGSSREYDWKSINITTDNIEDWVRAAVGNPPLATALTEALQDKLNGSLLDADRAIFLKYAAQLAIEASSLGTSILVNAIELLGAIDSDDFEDMLTRLQDDFKKGGGQKAASDLAKLLLNAIDESGGTPKFYGAYANDAQPSDVANAMIVLLLGEMGDDGDMSDLAAMGLTLKPGTPAQVQVMENTNPSDNARVIAAYLNLISSDNTGKFESNPFTYTISEILLVGSEPEPEDDLEDDSEDD